MLTTVYFMVGGKVAKAIIDEHFKSFFARLGAFETEKEALMSINPTRKVAPVKEAPPKADPVKEVPVKAVSKGDIGTGKPGTVAFHEAHIMGMEDVEAIEKYTQLICGSCPKKNARTTLKSYRRNAINMIRKFIKNGNQSR